MTADLSTAGADAISKSGCHHRWIPEPVTGPNSVAACASCGERLEFLFFDQILAPEPARKPRFG